ncbi:MAG: protein translocase subunit SecF [Chloroflexota bacterium]
MIDFVGRRFVYLFISAVILIVSVVSVAVFGIRPGLEFSSGSTMTLTFAQPVSEGELRSTLSGMGFADAAIQGTSRGGYLVTAPGLGGEKIAELKQALKDKFGPTAVFMYSTDQGDGTACTVVFSYKVGQAELEKALGGVGITGAGIKESKAQAFLVRTRTVGQEPGHDEAGNVLPSDMERLQSELRSRFGEFGMFDFYSVSPTVATDVVRKAVIAVTVASMLILLYITFAFRRMPNPFRWGICAVIAMVHNVVFVLGVFAILGWVLGVEVDAMFITGALTVLGYSVHDTIVVFDRVRENVMRGVSRDLAVTVNVSLMETLGRSLSTGLTVLFVLLALLLMGGVTIRYFILVMFLGIIIGTYSSIFVASQLLVVWERREWRRFVSWIPFLRPAS